MAELSCASLAERFLIPAFVYFFQMLYPFGWVARRDRRTAAAAGGCMLVRRDALERAGGIAAIRSEIIDDCALARRLKGQGPIWLGLTRRATSLRPYGGFLKIGQMISRSAYAQLGYSPLAAGRHRRRDGAGLSRAAASGPVRRGTGALAGIGRLAGDGAHLPADAALLPPVAAVGPGAPRHRRSLRILHRAVGGRLLARPRRPVEGPQSRP